ncbi:MAG: hypothetical protein KKC51_10235 [Verrucomicrobia bacterium]|nr:hypothetical protein [Verrucomicrobiota bacterium]
MNCRRARNSLGLCDGKSLPDDMAQHLQSCSSCQEFIAGMSGVQRLLALKRHETPDAGFENRCAETIRLRLQSPGLENVEREIESFWSTGFIIRAAAAAVLVLLVGFHVRSVRLSTLASGVAPREPSVAAERQRAPAPVNLLAQPAPVLVAPAPVMMLAQSNSRPGEIQYGPLPSQVVRFDY